MGRCLGSHLTVTLNPDQEGEVETLRRRPTHPPASGWEAKVSAVPAALRPQDPEPVLATDTYPSMAHLSHSMSPHAPHPPSGHGTAGGEGAEQCAPVPEPRRRPAAGPGVCGHRRAPGRSVMWAGVGRPGCGQQWPPPSECVAKNKGSPHTLADSTEGRERPPPSRDTTGPSQAGPPSPTHLAAAHLAPAWPECI